MDNESKSENTSSVYVSHNNYENMIEGHAPKDCSSSSYDDKHYSSAMLLLTLRSDGENGCGKKGTSVPEKKTESKKPRKNCSFSKHFKELVKFKNKFGHCEVPQRYEEDPGLGRWCSTVRKGYNQIVRSEKPCIDLSGDRLRRLQEVGFCCEDTPFSASFDKHCAALAEFKLKFGHCNVPSHYHDNPKLGKWCSQMRTALRQTDRGIKPHYNLSKDRIKRLEELNFLWKKYSSTTSFEKRCQELIDFKKKYGHCNVPKRFKENPSLGRWCGNLRSAYRRQQNGQKASINLSKDRIDLLSKIGFKWAVLLKRK